MDLFARAIEAVRAEVRTDHIVLVGHSLGTPAVLRYAHLYPAHTALVFVDSLMPAPSARAAEVAGAGAAMAGPNGRVAREAMVRSFFVASTTPAVQTKVLYDARRSRGDRRRRDERDVRADPRNPDRSDLGDLRRPVAHRHPRIRAEVFPKAEYTAIPDTGHFLMLEKPEEFNRLLLAFLSRQEY